MYVETNNCCPFLWYNNEVFCIVLAERAKLQRLQLDSAVRCRKELNIESIHGVDVTVFVFFFTFASINGRRISGEYSRNMHKINAFFFSFRIQEVRMAL